jgi:hypothetical protein
MLHVNDDNNDELFRKAAEDYLLRAENPDWETLLTKMTGTPPSIQANEILTPKKKRHLLFVLFNWPHKKNGPNSANSFFRIFRFSSWLEKSKKKISGLYRTGICICTGDVMMWYRHYIFTHARSV